MLSLIRSGARILLLRIDDGAVLEALSEEFPLTEKRYQAAMDQFAEGQTLLLIPPFGDSLGTARVFQAGSGPAELMVFILNSRLGEHIVEARILPRTILFRVSGDYSEVIKQMQSDFKAKVGKIPFLLRWRDTTRVAVIFTLKNLNRPVARKDLCPDVLYVKMPYEKLLRDLRSRAMTYFNEARGHKDWKSLEIRIFDSWERYDFQSRRLRLVIEEMELGLILGEGWGTDYARILMAVKIYRFHLATFLDVSQIKKILLGLEYNLSGKRLADLDLYEGKKKTGWGSMAKKEENRKKTGVRFREELINNLLPATRRELLRIEEEMVKQER